MSRFWSSVVHDLSPYVPGEQPKLDGIIKLNTNENPYPPSSRVLAAIASATDRLRLYPDPTATSLRETIAARYGVAPVEVFVGNGSDEVLAHTFQALLKHDAPLLFPDITYSFYPVYCRLYGIRYEEVPLDATMKVQIADFRRPCSAILLPNPNAPTGIGLPCQAIEALVAEHPDQLVVIDEAYVDFGGRERRTARRAPRQSACCPDPFQVPGSRRTTGWLCHWPTTSDRGAGAGEGQLQLLSPRLPRHRRCGRRHQRRCVVSGDAPTHHGEPRIPGPSPLCTGLRGSAIRGELRFRTPSQPQRRRARCQTSPAWRFGTTLQETPNRRLPAHYGRNRGSMQQLDCCGA